MKNYEIKEKAKIKNNKKVVFLNIIKVEYSITLKIVMGNHLNKIQLEFILIALFIIENSQYFKPKLIMKLLFVNKDGVLKHKEIIDKKLSQFYNEILIKIFYHKNYIYNY